MKKIHLFGMLLMALAMSMAFTSCEKDDGSTGIEMRMRNGNNGGDELRLLIVPELRENEIHINDGYTHLGITSSNNFKVVGLYDWAESEIVCVGNVSGLSRINNIPNSGWTQQAAVQPGQGYIIRRKKSSDEMYEFYYSQFCTYARVYVEDWIEGTSGGIIGAVIRYQDDWQ